MQIPIEIVTGVVSGVATALLLFAVKALWVNTLSPLLASIRYQGADLSGSWHAKVEIPKNAENVELSDEAKKNLGTSYFSLVLKQDAHRISGSMQFSFEGDLKKFNIVYLVEGEYWEGYLWLYLKSKDKKSYSQASMFMKLISNGTGLLGNFSFRNAITDQVHSVWLGLDRN